METDRAWKVAAEKIKESGYNLDMKNPHTAGDNYGDPGELLERLTAAETDASALRSQLKKILAEALTQ